MSNKGIDHLIINSAYQEPAEYWKYNTTLKHFYRQKGRRPAGYVIADPNATTYDNPGIFKELELVNKIRPRVKAWRENGYPGTTRVTRELIKHWNDSSQRDYPFFYCQLDAIETLIWLAEAPDAEKTGINIPKDGKPTDFDRICTKLCTGGGKTILMAMLIAWQVINKVSYPQDTRYSKNVLVVAPGLTVKSRLQVLNVGGEDNYYQKFHVVPMQYREKLNQGKIKIINWQTLAWDTEEQLAKKKSVDKRGVKSDEAYTREVLGDMAKSRNILVINDEAHHAWRYNPEVKIRTSDLSTEEKKDLKEEQAKATIWISGLDRIHKTRTIQTCYDFSATPFSPSGKKNSDEALFGWIVSDFGLNDGIESGLVKTPRVVVRDDAVPDPKTFKSKLYHIYRDETVKDDINRKVDEKEPLPDLLRNAYYVLGKDWEQLWQTWKDAGSKVPPVMITVANRTETAARIKYAFDSKKIGIDELSNPDYTIRIDSKIAELEGTAPDQTTYEDEDAPKLSKQDQALILRDTIDTVGQIGKRGEQIRNVISVGMLTEGWDAKTVTHIMGLRAFSSQLLCEQVVGRGLRRTSYDVDPETGMFSAEYVNIFGIPFTFLPHESTDSGSTPTPTTPKTMVSVDPEKSTYRIDWPNVIRINREMDINLKIDIDEIPPLVLDVTDTRIHAELAPVIGGLEDLRRCTEIDLEKLDANLRQQHIIFKTAAEVYETMSASWKDAGTVYGLYGQVVALTEAFLNTDKIKITPLLFETTPLRRRLMLKLNMNKIVQHLWEYIKHEQTTRLIPVLDSSKKTRGTEDMMTWYTSKPCHPTEKSHINHCVFDSAWEATEAYILDKNPHVTAWAKNDHLGFEIYYTDSGVVRKYYPDFLIKLDNGNMLILETKGQEKELDRIKRKALEEWIKAVNGTKQYGIWCNAVSYNIKDVDGIIQQALEAEA